MARVPIAPTGQADYIPNPAPKPALKKFSLPKAAAKADTKTAYPMYPDATGQGAVLAATITKQSAEFDALEGSLKANKAELQGMCLPAYYQLNQGKHEIPSSIAVKHAEGEVLITYQNRYKAMPDEAAVEALLGPDLTARYFRQSFELKVDGDLLPERTAQDLLDRLMALFEEFQCPAALESKACVKPVKEFHTARHIVLTPEQNLALNELCPLIPMTKTKGRK